jgi:hypothetical protein
MVSTFEQPTQLRHRCVDCHCAAPATDTEYTLISARFGWRLTPRTVAAGRTILEWRCAACWSVHKAKRESAPPSGVRGR